MLNPQPYIASLTGIRGVAALLVFLGHYGTLNPGIRLDLSIPIFGHALQFPFVFGFTGVDMFFVLSGFLLTLPFASASISNAPQQTLGGYYKRRILRVFPPYYAQLAIILVVGAWFVTWKPLSGWALAAHLGMFFNLGSPPVTPMVGVWWTLPIELSFYLILPFIASFMRPARWLLILIPGILLSVLYRAWSADHFVGSSPGFVFLAASHLPGSLPEFLLGSSAALAAQLLSLKSQWRLPVWTLDVLLTLSATSAFVWLWYFVLPNGGHYWAGHWTMYLSPTILGLTLSVLVLSLYWGSRIGSFLFANPVVYFFGMISYSLYLWHFVVLQQIDVVFGNSLASWPGFVRFLFCFMLVTLVSTISYFAFERPFFHKKAGVKPMNIKSSPV